jgi:hypothetical protein
MRYQVLAVGCDATLAEHGAVTADTLAALECLAASGRKLVLVTGRELDDLWRVFPGIAISRKPFHTARAVQR